MVGGRTREKGSESDKVTMTGFHVVVGDKPNDVTPAPEGNEARSYAVMDWPV